MMHDRVAIAAILLVAASAGLSAQTTRHEGSISVPAGVSVAAPSLELPAGAPAAVSPNGSFFAAICSDNVLRLWALPSGELVHTRDTKADPATALQFSNDGRLLAIAGQSGVIEVWDVSSWNVQKKFAAPSAIYTLAISPDNRLLAGTTEHETQIWNLTTQKRLAVLHAPFDCYCIKSLAFSPDSAMLASADGDTAIRIYDAHTGVLRTTATDLLLETFSLDFSPDGKSLLVGGADRTISVIDPMNGKIVRALPKQSGVTKALLVSPDGKQAAAMYPLPDRFNQLSVVLVWDLGAQTVRARFEKPGVFVIGGAFADGRFLLIGNSGGELGIWSLK
jgi:WD40 repeat protein